MPNLILSRKVKQTIHIGNDITIMVLGHRGQYTRLAIKAPKSLTVLRGELLEALERSPDASEDTDGGQCDGQ